MSVFKRVLWVLVAGWFLNLSSDLIFAQSCATPGKDGPNAAVSGIVNTYYPGTSSTVSIGATSISLGAADLNGSLTPIAVGDLVLIIQMQDSGITTTNDASYGGDGSTGFTSSGAGKFEYGKAANAVGTSGGTLMLQTGTINSYSDANYVSGTSGQKRFQVIRVPQYSSVTLTGTVTTPAWNGTTGGIVVLDVAGTLNLGGGAINVAGKGFRGGQGRTMSGSSGTNTDYRFDTSSSHGGSKGEGIAGTPRYLYDGTTATDTNVEGYPNGSFGRGAPGNAGGGGNDGNPSNNSENSGGGGGGNGGVGGTGGNSWNSNLPIGGFGGGAITSTVRRLVLGGGGGAGTSNNGAQTNASGANGGGIIIIRAGVVTGSGNINANGNNALRSQPTCCDDGAGGGGAGGSILVLTSSGSLTGITASANGGNGGSTHGGSASTTAPHGPGGGGGGGVILSNASLSSASRTGGTAGYTSNGTTNHYNATDGASGYADAMISEASLTDVKASSTCLPVLTVTKSTSTKNAVAGGTATYTIAVSNATGKADATEVVIADNSLPTGFTYASMNPVNLSGGATRPTTGDPTAGATAPSWNQFQIPAGGSVSITFVVNLVATITRGSYDNPATATYLDPTRTTITGTTAASYNPASSTNENVEVLEAYKSVKLTNDADSNSTPSPGDTLTWTIWYPAGTADITGFQITDQLPTGLTATAGSQTITVIGTGGTTYTLNTIYTGVAAGSVSQLFGAAITLKAGDIIKADIPATINTSYAGTLSNQANATGSNLTGTLATDNVDLTTTGLPTGITVPTGSQSQTQTAALGPTTISVTGVPLIYLVKSVSPTGNQVPGTDLTYAVTFTNAGNAIAQRLVLTDAIPDNTDYKLSSASSNLGTTGLTVSVEYSSDYSAASPGTATWTYTPVSGGGSATTGYDRNVKAVRWRVTAGTLDQNAPNNTGDIGFTVKVR
jgi:fimbrial isopeptide formation D2 family protein/uncharacterized repeat protein (TIGR01451 family)